MSDYLSVTSLTKYLKMKFDRDPYLERVYLTGQVSNFRRRPMKELLFRRRFGLEFSKSLVLNSKKG